MKAKGYTWQLPAKQDTSSLGCGRQKCEGVLAGSSVRGDRGTQTAGAVGSPSLAAKKEKSTCHQRAAE